MADDLVAATNNMMSLVGMGDKSFVNEDEIRENASSLLVAVFEVTFGTRIADIKRKPQTREDYAFNAQRVIDSLVAILPARVKVPNTVTGDAIASGSGQAVRFLVGLFADIAQVMKSSGKTPSKGSTSDAAAMSRLRSQLKGVQSPAKAASLPARTLASPPPVPHDRMATGGSAAMPVSQPDAEAKSPQPLDATRRSSGRRDPAAELEAAETERAQASALAVQRQQQSVMKRMMHQSQEELKHIQVMMDAAVKTREAEARVFEASAIRAATIRAKAAKYERRVMAVRTRRVLEDMTRHTLSMRIARSSRQASAASSLLKAVSAQQRLAAADKIRIQAEQQAQDLLTGQAKMAWLDHAARAANELLMEETQKQVAQRQAAIKSQKDALRVALSEMKADEKALLQAMLAEQAHAEVVFLAHNVDSLDIGMGAGNPEGIARQAIQHPVDTDASAQHVNTMARVQKRLGHIEDARQARQAHNQGMLRGIALDTGKLMGEADVMVAEAQQEVQASTATMRSLAASGGRR